MAKKLKVILSIVLSVSIVLSCSIFSLAQSSNSTSGNYNFDAEKKYAEAFLKSVKHSAQVLNPIPLLNLDNEFEAVCFSINNGGYIIVNTKDLSIPELSFEKSSPFKSQKETYFYNGPLAYMQKSGNKIKNLTTNKLYDSNAITTKYKKEPSDKTKKLDEITFSTVLAEKYLTRSLRTYVTTEEVPCAPTAMAIMTQFFDDVVNDAYVINSMEDPTLCDYMAVYLGQFDPDVPGGSNPSQIQDALAEYISDRGISASVGLTYSSLWSKITSNIGNNRPALLGLYEHSDYGNHIVVVHGYVMTTSYNYSVVNDGWGSNGVWISNDSTNVTVHSIY